MLLVVLPLIACSSKDTASSKPSGDQTPAPAATPTRLASGKLLSAEQVCDALTPDEVEADLHVKTVAHMLPKSGQYSAPVCGWFAVDAADAADARSVSVTMFFHDNVAASKETFTDKLESMCNLNRRGSGAGSGSATGSGSAGTGSGGAESGSAGSGSAGSGSGSGLGGFEVTNLGDEARFCGGLWVRKGTSFFVVSLGRRALTATRDERIAATRHLAEHVLPRLP